MTTRRKKTGDYGERLAAQYLIEQGYLIIAQKWRCPKGEIDIVASTGQTLVFVEVRTRRGDFLGTPEESVTPQKQAKLIELAYTYLDSYSDGESEWRIDVIAIQLASKAGPYRLNHIEYAIEG